MKNGILGKISKQQKTQLSKKKLNKINIDIKEIKKKIGQNCRRNKLNLPEKKIECSKFLYATKFL